MPSEPAKSSALNCPEWDRYVFLLMDSCFLAVPTNFHHSQSSVSPDTQLYLTPCRGVSAAAAQLWAGLLAAPLLWSLWRTLLIELVMKICPPKMVHTKALKHCSMAWMQGVYQ